MPQGQKFKAEDIFAKMREAEVELARGKNIPDACKQIGVREQMFYRWNKEYGGLRMDQAMRFNELEKENAHLKRLLADAELDKTILKEAASETTKRRRAVEHVRDSLGRKRMSERRACTVLNHA